MDATTRWETEAMRTGGSQRPAPPQPSRKRTTGHGRGDWVTLREAERETGVAVNTIRRWVKRAGLPSYLESDGDLSLRMVDLDAVKARAEELSASREAASQPEPQPSSSSTAAHADPDDSSAVPDGALLVPVDAWNKMLNQLGNLHEAGQQLADARERAAKAETEVTFLRERLADLRSRAKAEEQAARDEDVAEVAEAPPSGWRARRRARRTAR